MSDLISRSALINKIRGIVPGSQDVDFIVRLIGDEPTAFNMLRLHGYLTDSQADSICKKIQKKLVKSIKRMETADNEQI